jgi:lipopolysaccharide/colanic/teichoic acid biosynthesis glycosyltransferase
LEAVLEFRNQAFFKSPVVASLPIRESAYGSHILKVGHSILEDESDYTLEDILFTNVGVSGAINIINSTKKIDGIFICQELNASKVQVLKGLANERAIPFVLYTSKYGEDSKETALKSGVDDYFFGNINEVSMKRLSFIKKLKAYKKTRSNMSYNNPKVEEIEKIKLWSLKRTFDVIVSGTALLFLSPLLLVIALLVKLDSAGSIFYVSKRAGSGYRIFDFYKFRTMKIGADSELSKMAHLNQYSDQKGTVFFKFKNDPRVTKFGQFLRDTSLDELPQLFNVLLGDMSLVGNRPLPLYEAKQLTKDQIAWRFLAPAGITGLWQITKRGKENMSEDERIKLDMEYAVKNSFVFDISILLSTFPAMLQKQKV